MYTHTTVPDTYTPDIYFHMEVPRFSTPPLGVGGHCQHHPGVSSLWTMRHPEISLKTRGAAGSLG